MTARADLERELAGVVKDLAPADARAKALKTQRRVLIVRLLELPEDDRPTASEVARLAGVSHVYVGKLKPDLD